MLKQAGTKIAEVRASDHFGLFQQTLSNSCNCGQLQTMNHIVNTCPLTKFEGGLNLLHEADDDAVIRVESTATAALTHCTHTHTPV